MKLLILGGSGFVGQALIERLLARNGAGGGRIIVPSRRPQRVASLRTLPTVEVVGADVHDEVQLLRLVSSCDAVVNLVAILHGSPADFTRVHTTLPAALAHACAGTGVRRVLHVSALGVAPDAPSCYLRSKAAGEAALRAADLDLSVLRPSVIFGAHDRFLNLFAKLQVVAPIVPLAGAASRYQPVWVDDVADALARCLMDHTTVGHTYECAGPRTYSLAELVRLAGQWSGHPRPVLPLPPVLARLQAAVMSLLPGDPLLSADNLDSMQVPNIASGTLPGLEALGITPTPLEAVAPAYLGPSLAQRRFEVWRARARRL